MPFLEILFQFVYAHEFAGSGSFCRRFYNFTRVNICRIVESKMNLRFVKFVALKCAAF